MIREVMMARMIDYDINDVEYSYDSPNAVIEAWWYVFIMYPSLSLLLGDRKGAVSILESVKEVISWQTELGGRQGYVDIWMDGWMDGWIDRKLDLMDRSIDRWFDKWVYSFLRLSLLVMIDTDTF